MLTSFPSSQVVNTINIIVNGCYQHSSKSGLEKKKDNKKKKKKKEKGKNHSIERLRKT